jgi:mRNA interferase RelE/StbE
MDPYNIIFKPSVHKDLRRLSKKVIVRVLAYIDALKSDPFPPQAIKLSGAERLYRIRTGNYRIIYEVEASAKVVTIHYVRHRSEAYRNV